MESYSRYQQRIEEFNAKQRAWGRPEIGGLIDPFDAHVDGVIDGIEDPLPGEEHLAPVPVNEPDDETCPECGGELRLEGLLLRCVKCRNYTEGPCKL